jgi:hypothetical protein
MGIMQKLGGRKFLMALVVVGAGMFLEAKTDKGLSPTMAAFLASIVAAFSVANYASAAKYEDSRKGAPAVDSDLHDKVNQILQTMGNGFNGESVNMMLQVLTKQNNDLDEVKKATGQVASSMVNLLKR